MNNIDELQGRELDRAVAEALGWEWRCPAGAQCKALRSPGDIKRYPGRYRPPMNSEERCYDWAAGLPHYSSDCNLSMNFLFVDGLRYEFEEHYINYPVLFVRCFTTNSVNAVAVKFCDHASRSTAYATAMCRAFLKAMEHQR